MINNNYPLNLPTAESDGTIDNDYRYGGKEFDTRNGVNVYDFGARTYAPDIARFWQPDPMSHDYHWLSPYAYCGGDPVNFIDPNGMQRYYVGMDGRIITEKEAKEENDKGEYPQEFKDFDQIIIQDANGNIVAQTPKFEIETIERTIHNTAFDKGQTEATDYTSFVVRGDDAAIEMFELLANTITGSNGIEYSLQQTGVEGKSGLNFITTSNLKGREVGASYLFYKQLKFGYTVRTWIHSHPTGLSVKGDIPLRNYVNKNRYPQIIHKIYHVPTKTYYDYTSKDKL